MTLRSFSSIGQFRHAVATVQHRARYIGLDADGKPLYDMTKPLPTLKFEGMTKIHGTNAGVCFDFETWEILALSRERILYPASKGEDTDNHGFAGWVHGLGSFEVRRMFRAFERALPDLGYPLDKVKTVHLYGELAGQGIKRGTGISKLPRCWYIFKALVTSKDDQEIWMTTEHLSSILDREMAIVEMADYMPNQEGRGWQLLRPLWTIEVDFNQPELAATKLEELTLEVEAKCPVANDHQVIGTGEGIVWTCVDPSWTGDRLWFKTKGEEHKVSEARSLVEISPEVLANRQAFAEAVLTEARLNQGLETLTGEISVRRMGEFLKWIGQDVLKEESDVLEASGLERKEVMANINKRAKEWFMARLEN